MAQQRVSVWYDPEGDFLEVIWERKVGYFRETEDDRVMGKVDLKGNTLGFHMLAVSTLKGASLLEVVLPSGAGQDGQG